VDVLDKGRRFSPVLEVLDKPELCQRSQKAIAQQACISCADTVHFSEVHLFSHESPRLIQSSDIPLFHSFIIAVYRGHHLLPAHGISAETS